MTDAGIIAAACGAAALLMVLVGVPLSDRRAARLAERPCPTCKGTFETCRCGTHKPGVPR
ncbi:hypothetical protein QNO07_09610 [Streptomyces sp. 549]|uniref:hypothetical protein n=1 Tax=Streptomyces sp. 549 TaxID=3049076 RepID=UPI0024C30462|nr:hypothetical protein [Streptomyces sp. 549]MDK1473676.1 hypothetical protein [Streptomyces sp. 549]